LPGRRTGIDLSYYLTAAGVGRIRIVDRDRVELSNLNRQILHTTGDLGEPKVLSALDKLTRLNPHCRVEPFRRTSMRAMFWR
jgi:adenylyltransferase/sulfurtransferase